MVKLYTWLPLEPFLIFEGFRPDAGHSSMEVFSETNSLMAYVSFWPAPTSLIGEITQLMKPRPQRRPSTYAQEIDPTIGFMQRPADFIDEVHGVDEEQVTEMWTAIEDTDYDLLHWNCSNICKLLLISSFDPCHRDQVAGAAGCTPADLFKIGAGEELLEKLRYLTTSPFIDCRPEDVRRMVEAYEKIEMPLRTANAPPIKSTPA
jgi:hypothetical protein